MKRFYLIIAAMAALAIGCNKLPDVQAPDTAAELSEATGLIEVSTAFFTETKASTADIVDNQVNSCQILVFDAAGKLEASRYFDNWSTAVSNHKNRITTSLGPKTVYVVANLSDGGRVKAATLTELAGVITDLSENSITNLVMSGMNTITVTAYNANEQETPTPQSLTVRVKRLASLITLSAVNVNFEGTPLQGSTFTIKQIYVKNVMGKSPVAVQSAGVENEPGTGLPSVISDAQQTTVGNWYSPLTFSASAPAVTYDGKTGSWLAVNCASDNDTATSIGRSYIVYPNKNSGDNHNDTFDGGKRTRLVIKAHVKTPANSPYSADIDEDTNYVFNLPPMLANHRYVISSVKITMMGLSDEDEAKDKANEVGIIEPFIVVDPWGDTVELSYEH